MTDNKDLIKRYIDEATDEQADLLYLIISGGLNMGIDDDTMKKLGYGTFDWAKPQPYMDKLREMGVPEEMLYYTVYDYTKADFGELWYR